jgi:hypothetical protein
LLPPKRTELPLGAVRTERQDFHLAIVVVELKGKIGTPASRELIALSAALDAHESGTHLPLHVRSLTRGPTLVYHPFKPKGRKERRNDEFAFNTTGEAR